MEMKMIEDEMKTIKDKENKIKQILLLTSYLIHVRTRTRNNDDMRTIQNRQ